MADPTYAELLEARAAGHEVDDAEILRARRREAAAEAEHAEVKAIAADARAAAKAYRAKIDRYVADALERTAPLHERLKDERAAYVEAEAAVSEAVKARAAAMAKVNTTHAAMVAAVAEHLHEQGANFSEDKSAGYPVAADGSPDVSTYYDHQRRLVIDGVEVLPLEDRPDWKREAAQ